MTTSPITRSGRRPPRGVLAAITIAVAASLSVATATANAAAAAPASPGGLAGEIAVAFQGSANGLQDWRSDFGFGRNLGATVAPGTSPAITINPQDIRLYRVAFQGGNHDLWTLDITRTPQFVDTGLGMMPGTSPAAVNLSNDGYQIAFQANSGILWTTGSAGTGSTGQPMAPGTSPAIVALANGGYEIVYQDPTGHLAFAGTGFTTVTTTMAPGTNPSIIPTPNPDNFRIAWQGANHDLFTSGPHGGIDLGLGMAPGTSPSASVAGNNPAGTDYEIAFHANTGALWVTGTLGTGSLNLGMMPGTNPSITQQPVGPGYEIAFQANTGTLWLAGVLTENTGLPMSGGSSPSITDVVNFFAGG